MAAGCPEAIIQQVIPLVAEHMNYKGAMASKRALRKLAHRLYPATIRQLTSVVWADHAGRPPLPVDREDMLAELLQRAEADGCADDVPEVVKGRHLLAAGWTPGVHMGKGLQNCFNAWLNGRFDTAEDGWSESTFFEMRYYKKGTLHIKFKDEALWNGFNLAAARGRN